MFFVNNSSIFIPYNLYNLLAKLFDIAIISRDKRFQWLQTKTPNKKKENQLMDNNSK